MSQGLGLGRSCGHSLVIWREKKESHISTSGFLHSKNSPSPSFKALLNTHSLLRLSLPPTVNIPNLLPVESILPPVPKGPCYPLMWTSGASAHEQVPGGCLGRWFTEHQPWEQQRCPLSLRGKHDPTAVSSFPSIRGWRVLRAAALRELECYGFTPSRAPSWLLGRPYPVAVLPSINPNCSRRTFSIQMK